MTSGRRKRMYTVKKAKDEIKNSIKAYHRRDKNGKYIMREENRLPFYLEGEPGVGKTEMAKQIAKELGIGFVSLSITHHTRNTVLGLPVICEDESIEGNVKYTQYTMSEIMALVEKEVKKGHKEGILLIDEFACMAESLVAPMLAFLQTKNIGTHVLPEGWILILCSNPPKYNKSSRVFDTAIMDRVRKMKIVSDGNEFIEYAKENEFHSTIIEYLCQYKEDIQVCHPAKGVEEAVIVTTRGWENLSHCLIAYEELHQEVSFELIYQFIKSKEIAGKFYRFYEIFYSGMTLKELENVLNDKNVDSCVKRVKEQSYAVKWNIVKIMADYLIAECEKYVETENELHKIEEKLEKGYCSQEVFLDKQKEEIIKKLKEKEEISNQKLGNACRFIEGIDGKENLMEAFLNMLNQSMGILDVLIRFKNFEYLKNSKRVFGNMSA